MSKYLFLGRLKDQSDRDCCLYIENKNPRWQCDHYFEGITLHGSCFCHSGFPDYDDLETVLSREEYKELIVYNGEIGKLGHGIKKASERYKNGCALSKEIQHIFDKLNSDEAKKFQGRIIEEEKKYLVDKYDISEEDVEEIFENYYLDYRDRSIIGCIYSNTSELGYDEAFNLGYIKPGDVILERYFDYEKFGEDLLKKEQYMELSNGRVLYLNY